MEILSKDGKKIATDNHNIIFLGGGSKKGSCTFYPFHFTHETIDHN